MTYICNRENKKAMLLFNVLLNNTDKTNDKKGYS